MDQQENHDSPHYHSITALAIAHFPDPDAPFPLPLSAAGNGSEPEGHGSRSGPFTEREVAPREFEVWGLRNLSSPAAMEASATLLGRYEARSRVFALCILDESRKD